MRDSVEMFALFKDVVRSDERIRAMTLEGSRVNPAVTPDAWQDYDLTFLVTDVGSFTRSDEWLARFGDIVLMQKPEAMELFPARFPHRVVLVPHVVLGWSEDRPHPDSLRGLGRVFRVGLADPRAIRQRRDLPVAA